MNVVSWRPKVRSVGNRKIQIKKIKFKIMFIRGFSGGHNGATRHEGLYIYINTGFCLWIRLSPDDDFVVSGLYRPPVTRGSPVQYLVQEPPVIQQEIPNTHNPVVKVRFTAVLPILIILPDPDSKFCPQIMIRSF